MNEIRAAVVQLTRVIERQVILEENDNCFPSAYNRNVPLSEVRHQFTPPTLSSQSATAVDTTEAKKRKVLFESSESRAQHTDRAHRYETGRLLSSLHRLQRILMIHSSSLESGPLLSMQVRFRIQLKIAVIAVVRLLTLCHRRVVNHVLPYPSFC